MNRKAALACVVALLVPSTLLAGSRPLYNTQLLAHVPAPGFPEGILVLGNTVYVSGPATFGTAGHGPSVVDSFDTVSGAHIGRIEIQGEDLTQEHALSCITSDRLNRLYVLSTQLGVVRIDPSSGLQEVYATIPHLPACFPPGPCAPGATDPACFPPGPCAPGTSGQSCFPPGPCDGGRCFPPGPCAPGTSGDTCFPPGPCAPVAFDRGSLPNDIGFDDGGNLFVTDSFQATIFRISPYTRVAEPWYQDPRFDTSTIPGFSIGLNGVRVSPDRSKLFFTASFGGSAGVWTLPSVNNPTPGQLTQFFAAQNQGDIMDGVAFDQDGRIYVALAGANQIQILERTVASGGTTGHSLKRFPSAAANANLPVPYDNPANIAFNARGSILVTNHALFGNPADAAVLDAFVAELGATPPAPPMP